MRQRRDTEILETQRKKATESRRHREETRSTDPLHGAVNGIASDDSQGLTLASSGPSGADGTAILNSFDGAIDLKANATDGYFSMTRAFTTLFGSQVQLDGCDFHAAR